MLLYKNRANFKTKSKLKKNILYEDQNYWQISFNTSRLN